MKPHEVWLKKSRNDLNSAVKLISGNDPITDTAIYHTQQCAEKAIKGYLAFHSIPVPKTHDLRVLIDTAVEKESDFNQIVDCALSLNPYATAFRYPDLVFEPKLSDVTEAITAARKIFEFVSSKLERGLFE